MLDFEKQKFSRGYSFWYIYGQPRAQYWRLGKPKGWIIIVVSESLGKILICNHFCEPEINVFV